jgi:RND family efflux transporter MFP subunit
MLHCDIARHICAFIRGFIEKWEDRAMRVKHTVAAIAALLVLSGCDDAQTEAQQGAAPPPPTVTVATPLVKELIEFDEVTGRFEAVEDVIIRARVTGYVDSINFEDGQIVEAGQVLFTIDPRTYQADVAGARADLIAAETSQKLAASELARLSKLTSGRTVTESALDTARQEKDSADANVAAARAALALAQLNVDFSTVKSPVSGRISNSRVDVGDLVIGDANPTELTRVVSLDPMHFVFDLSERDYLGYQRARSTGEMANARGSEVMVQLNLSDESDWAREGRIDFVDNVVDKGTGTIRLRAVVPNTDGVLTPGLFGRLRLPGSPLYDAILVPDSAIMSDQAQKLLLAVKDDGTVEAKHVKLGPREFGLRIIRSGIEPTDKIVINGLQRARPGQAVTPQDGEITLPTDNQ